MTWIFFIICASSLLPALADQQMRLPPILTIFGDEVRNPYDHDVLKLPARNRTRSFRPGGLSGTDLTVDVLLLIDYAVYKLMSKNFEDIPESQRKEKVVQYMKEYYGLTFSAIAQRYEGKSFPVGGGEATIKPRLSGLFIATSEDEDTFSEPKTFKLYERSRRKSIDGADILYHVADWFKQQQDSGKYASIDHVMLITGNDITMMGIDPDSGETARLSTMVGVAYKSEICNRLTVSVSEEDMRFEVIDTAAHELGHNLGADHDGDGEGADCEPAGYIMGGGDRYGHPIQNQFKFSQCSTNSIGNYMKQLNAKGQNCLADTGAEDADLKKLVDVVPGFKFDMHQQCQIFMRRKDSYYCLHNDNDELENICTEPRCSDKRRHCGSFSARNRVLPGTPCGKDKWCMNGACVKASVPIPTTENGCVMKDSPQCDSYTKRECEYYPKMCCNKCKTLLGK